jgi:hypothetical protein
MSYLSKVCLVLIALSLATIAVHTAVKPQPVRAATHYKYLVEGVSREPASIQDELNKRSAEGWELAAPVYVEGNVSVTLIFRQAAR